MTIRLRADTNRPVEPRRVATLITRALLTPTQDDAPNAQKTARTGMGWVHWSDALGASLANVD